MEKLVKRCLVKERVSKVMTRDMFFDIGGEIANGMASWWWSCSKNDTIMTK